MKGLVEYVKHKIERRNEMKGVAEQDQQRMFLLAKLIYKYIGAENKLAMKELFEIDFVRKEYSKTTVYNYIVLAKKLLATGIKPKSLPVNFANYILKLAGKPEIQEQPKATVEVASKPVEESLESKIEKLIKQGEKLNEKYKDLHYKYTQQQQEIAQKLASIAVAYEEEAKVIEEKLKELRVQQAKKELLA